MIKYWIIAGLVLLLAGTSGCSTEPNLDSVPEIKFSTEVQGILSAHCNFEGCHGGSGGGEAGSLVTYADVMGYIKAGNAHGSKLYQTITKRGFVERMPPSGYSEVSAENVKLIYWWIEQGAKNN